MSDEDGIQLSPQLMSELRAAMEKQDPRTKEDTVAMQYLVAAAGMLLSDVNNPQLNKDNVLNELMGFMKHVYDYMEQTKPQAAPPQQEAFGVWKPNS